MSQKTAMDDSWRPPNLQGDPPVPPGKPTGIKVCRLCAVLTQILIVGAGFGGLACAIQSRIEGHEVHIFEQFEQMLKLGIPYTDHLYRGFDWNLSKCWSLLPSMGDS